MIHWYGVMIALAFLAGLWTAMRRAERVNIAGEKIADLVFWIMVAGMVGARTVYVTTYWSEFAHQPISEIFMIQHGGLVYYGSLIGAALAMFIYVRWKRLSFLKDRRHPRSQHRPGKCLRPHRLSPERLLLRPRLAICPGPSAFPINPPPGCNISRRDWWAKATLRCRCTPRKFMTRC